ncbi:MAG TPA: hypothetical protein VF766_04905 [Pyrinomonadaceae bacterium]
MCSLRLEPLLGENSFSSILTAGSGGRQVAALLANYLPARSIGGQSYFARIFS